MAKRYYTLGYKRKKQNNILQIKFKNKHPSSFFLKTNDTKKRSIKRKSKWSVNIQKVLKPTGNQRNANENKNIPYFNEISKIRNLKTC